MTTHLKSFHDLPEAYIVLDIETTGLPDGEGAPGIVSLGLTVVEKKRVVLSREFRLKPYRKIKEEAYRIHGISNSEADTFPSIEEQWPEIRSYLNGKFIVIHNASFDWPIIEFHIEKFRLETLTNLNIFCSQKSAIDFAGEKGIPMSSRGPSLDDLTTFLGIKPLRVNGLHGAEIDTRQTALVIEALRDLSNVMG